MNKKALFLPVFAAAIFLMTEPVLADETRSAGSWNPFGKKKTAHHEPFRPYLESTRELQIPQWEDENWYVEDWTSQEGGVDLIQGFYDADILRNQEVKNNKMPVITVGPNFYHLSGLDKRRVMKTVDTIYGFTASKENGSFMLKDWDTKKFIGAFDKNGLRLN